MQSPNFIGLLGAMQAWGTRRRCVRALDPESRMSLFSTALNSDSKIKNFFSIDCDPCALLNITLI